MKYIFANWKQHFSHSETIQKFNLFLQELSAFLDDTSTIVGIAASHESLEKISSKNNKRSLWIGAQNCSSFERGSFTGGVAARSLREVGAKFVFVGHSERRKFFKETNQDIALQVTCAIEAGLVPILCVGESLEERKSGDIYGVLRSQIVSALKDVHGAENRKKIMIAYEPQYAIGTGVLPELKDIEKTVACLQNIKNEVSLNLCGVPLLYGGSINEKNYESVITIPFIQGFLVGGASLQIQSFKKIVSGCALIDKKYLSGMDKNYNVVEKI